MGLVYVFPGQGSQRRGMGKELFDRFPDLVAQADEALGYFVAELCLRDPDRVLNRTEYTQPALYVVSVLHYLDRVGRGERPVVVAGHSLGEYCALFAAGAFDFATGVRLVRKRGELMSQAPKGAMAAVINLDQERVAEILAGLPYPNIDLSNVNSRRQCTLSGAYDELLAPDVREAYVEAGASFIPLNVSAAFHSRSMISVQEEFARYLAGFSLGRLEIPVVANWTARFYPETGYADHLTHQISSPVRWYESVSWLLHQGHRTFEEVGPGTVLTKLIGKILDDPLPAEDSGTPVAAPAVRRPKLIFMYGGQGTQYHTMGKELYDTHSVFRNTMDRCSEVYEVANGSSLVDAIYDISRKGKDFDDVLHSHAALYSIGYSLTETLRDEGFQPDAVLGHSLGEYIAATVAGAMSFEDGLNLVMRQARLLARECRGGMLSVLAAPDLHRQRPDLFARVSLAAVNSAGNFVVSGDSARLAHIQTALDEEGVIAVKLSVRQAFHSDLLDGIRRECLDLGASVAVREPRLPIYSAMLAGSVGAASLRQWDEHLWDVIRRPVRFDELVASAFGDRGNRFFVDLSATGSFANFAKHDYGPDFRCVPAINQFGSNTASMRRLLEALTAERSAPPLVSAR